MIGRQICETRCYFSITSTKDFLREVVLVLFLLDTRTRNQVYRVLYNSHAKWTRVSLGSGPISVHVVGGTSCLE